MPPAQSAMMHSQVPPTPSVEAEREKLTPRETEIITLLAKGASNKEMARVLNVAESTVKIHVQSILKNSTSPAGYRLPCMPWSMAWHGAMIK